MAFVKLEYVAKVMEDKKLSIFQVLEPGTGSKEPVKIFSQDDDGNVKDAVEDMLSCVNSLHSGWVIIKLFDKPTRKETGERGGNYRPVYEYKVKVGEDSIGETKRGGTSHDHSLLSIMKDFMGQNHALQIEMQNIRHEHALKEMERKLKENEEGKKNPYLDKLIDVLGPVVAHHYMNPQAAAAAAAAGGIHGVEEEAEAANETAKEKLSKAVKRLLAIDKNLPDTLTILADFAEKNPSQYHSFIPMVKNMK